MITPLDTAAFPDNLEHAMCIAFENRSVDDRLPFRIYWVLMIWATVKDSAFITLTAREKSDALRQVLRLLSCKSTVVIDYDECKIYHDKGCFDLTTLRHVPNLVP